MMGRTLKEVIKKLPPSRQMSVERLAQTKIEEMLAHAKTLKDFRKAVGKTQAQVAESLGIKQHAVSQLEQRSDTYVSTLRKFLETLGMRLELSVVTAKGTKIELPNFHPWIEEPVPRRVTKKSTASVRVSGTPKPKRTALERRA
jgi:transcriptional regulator with XRE-family HTH domain